MRILCSILARQVQGQLVGGDWPMLGVRDDPGPVQPFFIFVHYLSHSTSTAPPNAHTGRLSDWLA